MFNTCSKKYRRASSSADQVFKVLLIANRIGRNVHGDFARYSPHEETWNTKIEPLLEHFYSLNRYAIADLPRCVYFPLFGLFDTLAVFVFGECFI